MFYVNAYERTQRYGGPEEGGWWFNTYRFIRSELVTPSQDAAYSWRGHLYRSYKGSEIWSIPNVPDNDDCDYDHMVSVSDLFFFVEDEPGQDSSDYPEGGWS